MESLDASNESDTLNRDLILVETNPPEEKICQNHTCKCISKELGVNIYLLNSRQRISEPDLRHASIQNDFEMESKSKSQTELKNQDESEYTKLTLFDAEDISRQGLSNHPQARTQDLTTPIGAQPLRQNGLSQSVVENVFYVPSLKDIRKVFVILFVVFFMGTGYAARFALTFVETMSAFSYKITK